MNKVLLDRTPLWEIRPEEQVIPDINSLQVDNSREQAKLYYEANKEEIWANTLREKDKEIKRLQNIIDELEKYINKTKLEEFEKVYGKRYGKTFTQAEVIICNMILNKLKELKEGNKDE